jgi:hypothetical protein
MDDETRHMLIQRYKAGYATVETALDGLNDADLDRAPADGGWTARQVIHHLADSEMTSALRLRRLLAEEQPLLQGYDEQLFARVLFYTARPIAPSLAAFKAARESTAAILDRLGPEHWQRAGVHSESGPYGVETWLTIYAAHAHDHAAQILRACGRI